MDRETKNTHQQSRDADRESEGMGLRPAQVAAAALAAVTAAFLGSSLGVYGTVLGAGLISVVTTVGSEVYLRSLDRTKAAARHLPVKAQRMGMRAERRGGSPSALPDQPTLPIMASAPYGSGRAADTPGAEPRHARRQQWWKRRWSVVAATSVLAFVLGMVALTSYEGVTGRAVSGADGTTVSSIVRGTGQQTEKDQPDPVEQPDPTDPSGSPESDEPSSSDDPQPSSEPTGESATSTSEDDRSTDSSTERESDGSSDEETTEPEDPASEKQQDQPVPTEDR